MDEYSPFFPYENNRGIRRLLLTLAILSPIRRLFDSVFISYNKSHLQVLRSNGLGECFKLLEHPRCQMAAVRHWLIPTTISGMIVASGFQGLGVPQTLQM